MEKKNIASAILIFCLLSFILGLMNFSRNNITQSTESKVTQLVSNLEVTGDKIALLNIDGVISADYSSPWDENFSAENFLDTLDKAKSDSKVKAILIRINSPGGTVATSQDIYDAVLEARKTKPIVVSMADVAASGGYYIASAADRIVAQKGTMTGSIGVIFNFVDIATLADKVGINSNVIKSGKFKDSGNMYRKMQPDEKSLFQASVNSAYNQFIEAIKVGRVERNDTYTFPKKHLTVKTLKHYADGRIFLGTEAYNLGFVDALGSLKTATAVASQLAGYEKSLPVVNYNKLAGLKAVLMNMENIFKPSLKEVVPYSYSHNSLPLFLWE